MQVWVKIYKDEVITQSKLFVMKKYLNRENFEELLRKICADLDIGTPVGLKTHFTHFYDFNVVKYLPADFIEPVHFDYLLLEACY